MEYKKIEIITERRFLKKLKEFVEKTEIVKYWYRVDQKAKSIHFSVVCPLYNFQKCLDNIDKICGRTSDTHVIATPTAMVLTPGAKELEKIEKTKTDSKSTSLSREELYNKVTPGVKLNTNFVILVLLSTIVAAIGLLENNVAVIIGAMVIAPLLGPNLAISLGTTLGDGKLIMDALKVNALGIVICLVVSILIGIIWPFDFSGPQIIMRTEINYGGLILALASGAAAALSITTGLSEVLVGVMVSASLLPALAVFGILIGCGEFKLALGAGLLFAANIVSINFVSNITFMLRGVRPARWYEKQKAKAISKRNMTFWAIMLLMLAIIISLRHYTWNLF